MCGLFLNKRAVLLIEGIVTIGAYQVYLFVPEINPVSIKLA